MNWLKQDLAAHPNTCALVYWHKPYFTSSAKHSGFKKSKPVWEVLYANGVDIVLAGHNHHYERFAPQDPDGHLDVENGIRQFVVGSGGASLYNFRSTLIPNSEKALKTHGVLKLTLRNGGYHWAFIGVNDNLADAGTGICSGPAAKLSHPPVVGSAPRLAHRETTTNMATKTCW